VLAEVGMADAVLARELEDGSLMLIDGHLRAETAADATVPVLVLDVNEAEADKLLATLDPLAAMADSDAVKLDELLRNVDTGSEALQLMLANLAADSGVVPPDASNDQQDGGFEYQQQYGVTVMCRDEAHQQEVYDRLVADGLECKVVVV
jgi:hypothetical protein